MLRFVPEKTRTEGRNMPSYKGLYLYLLHSITEALAQLEQGNTAMVENLLKEAQAASEEQLIDLLEKNNIRI